MKSLRVERFHVDLLFLLLFCKCVFVLILLLFLLVCCCFNFIVVFVVVIVNIDHIIKCNAKKNIHGHIHALTPVHILHGFMIF